MTDPKHLQMAKAIRFKFETNCEKPNVVALDRLIDDIATALSTAYSRGREDERSPLIELCATVSERHIACDRKCFCANKIAKTIRSLSKGGGEC